jgi:pullulanase/glycogen debranching enzyme
MVADALRLGNGRGALALWFTKRVDHTLRFSSGGAGDGLLRTQDGNNNSCCQDNELSWFDWARFESQLEMLNFTRGMIVLRRRRASLTANRFLPGPGGPRSRHSRHRLARHAAVPAVLAMPLHGCSVSPSQASRRARRTCVRF